MNSPDLVMRGGMALLAVGLAAACAGPAGPESPRILLERGEPGGKWRATYVLEAPAGYLRFQRQAGFYREEIWEIQTPGWSFERDGEDQVLTAEPGMETDRLVVQFPVYTRHIPKEYELFFTFTDGSVALYTGHFYVTTAAAGASDEEHEETGFLRQVEMSPASGERLVVRGEVFEDRHVWEDRSGDGTYVYFGGIDPVETGDMIAIIDPGAPSWLVARLKEALPSMFALYSERLGETLPWKPVVLFSFDDADVSGMDSGGGTLTGLVQMSARGRGWREETPWSSESALYLIAHEAAHFWNGQLHEYEEMSDSWMHEGSADAMASILLFERGAIDGERLAARRTAALNECALGLMDGPLVSSNRRGQFRNYYTCGEIIAVWSAAALPGEEEPGRLFEIWRRLFRLADPEDGGYDRGTYFEALASLGVQQQEIDALRDFVDSEHPDPAAAILGMMATAGIVLERPARPNPEERIGWGAAALRHLMTTACGGRFSLRTEERALRTFPIEGCPPFPSEMVVVSIEGHPVASDGDLGFRDTAARCGRGEPVTLGLDDGTGVGVPCPEPPSPRPAPLAFPR